MAIKGRETLYSIFYNGAVPTQNDFRDLIDSALNRRDDNFFGEWQQGMKYCVGDVVIFGKALYKLIQKEETDPCPPEEDQEENDCYCSLIDPPSDMENWCLLELDMKDKDWEIICVPEGDPTGIASKIYQLTAQVGIGTDNPKALLDLTDKNKILLEPNDAGSPDISLHKALTTETGNPATHYVKYRLTEEVCWETDTPAYVFKLVNEAQPANSIKAAKAAAPQQVTPLLLMKVTANERQIPQVGVGIAQPRGGMHVHQNGRGQVITNPANHQEPGVLIVNLKEDSNGYYFLTGVNDQYSFLATNAADGFRFKKDNTDKDDLMNCSSAAEGKDLMAILGDGRVGIGTVDPKSYVEITDNESGAVRIQLGNDDKNVSNPAISLNNLRPNIRQPNTYLTLGVDDDYSIFNTDAPSGYVFKKGGPYGTNDNEVNINQGKSVVYIAPEGNLGIKTDNPPVDYDLDINGHLRSLTAYLETNSKTVLKTSDLKDDEILEKIKKLRPTRFIYKESPLKEEGEHIGFMAQNVYEVFPELVKKTGPDEKAVAYGNLTAVLVQAIQNQQKMIKDLDERVCDLEAKLGIGD